MNYTGSCLIKANWTETYETRPHHVASQGIGRYDGVHTRDTYTFLVSWYHLPSILQFRVMLAFKATCACFKQSDKLAALYKHTALQLTPQATLHTAAVYTIGTGSKSSHMCNQTKSRSARNVVVSY